MKRQIFTYAIALLLLFSANGCKDKGAGVCYHVRPEMYEAIHSYAEAFPDYDAFLIMPSTILPDVYKNNKPGYIVGPLFRGMLPLCRGAAVVKLFDIGGKRVFLYSRGAALFEECLKQDDVHSNNKTDKTISIRYTEKKINPKFASDCLMNYLTRGEFLYYDNDSLHVVKRPDERFLPILREDYCMIDDSGL